MVLLGCVLMHVLGLLWQVLRSLAEGCGLNEGAQSLGLGLHQQQQHSSGAQNGSLQPRESMDGVAPQYEQLQVFPQSPRTHAEIPCCTSYVPLITSFLPALCDRIGRPWADMQHCLIWWRSMLLYR